MRLVVGCDLEEFRTYYRAAGWAEDLGPREEEIVKQDPSHLIVFRDGDQVIGHAIWHQTGTEEAPEEHRETLENLLGGRKAFVELWELLLRKEHRGKGHGTRFFQFFESFIAARGHDSIVFYAFDPAAIAICRQRGYKEAYSLEWMGRTFHVFYLPLKRQTRE